MWQHHLRFSIRQLARNRFYSVISIAGLAVSMASSLLMLLYLHGELTFDRWNEEPGQVYRVVFNTYPAGLVTLVTATLTISAQTIRAAVSNPVKSLRNE